MQVATPAIMIPSIAGPSPVAATADSTGLGDRFSSWNITESVRVVPIRTASGDVSGENHGSTALKIINDGEQQVPQVVWKSLGKDSSLRAEWQTPIRDNGLLFGLDNVGSAGPITNLVCVRAADGERLWAKTRFGKSNLTLADGKLFLSTMEGELVIVKATADAFQETARAEVLKSTRQAPVIADGRLYLRDDVEVVCIDVRKK